MVRESSPTIARPGPNSRMHVGIGRTLAAIGLGLSNLPGPLGLLCLFGMLGGPPLHAQATPDAPVEQGLRNALDAAQSLLVTDIEQCITELEGVARSAREAGLPAITSLARSHQAQALLHRDGLPAAATLLADSVRAMPAYASSRDRAESQLIATEFHFWSADYAKAAIAIRDAQSIATSIDDPKLSARCMLQLHRLLSARGIGHDADAVLTAACDALSAAPRSRDYYWACFALSTVADTEGREANAEHLRATAHAYATERSDRVLLADLLAHAVFRASLDEDWQRARELAKQRVELAEAQGSRLCLAVALDHVAWIAARAKDPELATTALTRAFSLSDRIGIASLQHELQITARAIAVLREDATRVLELEKQLEAFHSDPDSGARSAVARTSQSILETLRDEQAERRRSAAERQARLAKRRDTREQTLRTYRWVASILALLVTAGIALSLFHGKRRAERMHARVQEQSDRFRASEEARERLQQNLNQLERLEALGIFASGFAHDFNNLLCSISGHAELTRDRAQGPERESIDAILESAHKGQELCQRLLDYARPSADDAETNDIGRLLLEAKILLDSAPDQTGELVVLPATDELPVRIERAAFEQILIGVVANARDEEVGATKVQLTARKTDRIPAVTEEGAWFGRLQNARGFGVVHVHDNGCGIEPNRLKRLFDPFYTTKFEGRGLGLSAALGLVGAYGGAFHVSSRAERGSCFSIWLPIAESSGPVSKSTSGAGSAKLGEPLKVLAIDDEPTILAYVHRALRQSSHDVLTADNKADAVDLIAKHGPEFDIVLLDLSLPDVDGTELLDHVVEQMPKLPLVVMSGHDQQFIEDRTRGYPVAAILHKPFVPDALHDALARAAQAIERTS